MKKETAEGLALFRQQQEEADKKARSGDAASVAKEGSPVAKEESWIAGGRKRKRTKEKEILKGVKVRRSSTANEADKGVNQPTKKPETPKSAASANPASQALPANTSASIKAEKIPAPAKGSLGLVDYRSDEDDDW